MIRSVGKRCTLKLKNLLIVLRRLQRKINEFKLGHVKFFKYRKIWFYYYFDAMHCFSFVFDFLPIPAILPVQTLFFLLQAFFVPSEFLLFSYFTPPFQALLYLTIINAHLIRYKTGLVAYGLLYL